MNKGTVYVIHGFTASSKANWFPWLEVHGHSLRISMRIPDLPGANDPHLEPWLEEIEEAVKEMDENTIFIGHSLGCITAIRYVLRKGIKIKGAIFVSGFMGENPMEVQKDGLSEFVNGEIDVEQVKRLIPKRIMLTATNDDIVPWEATKEMAQRLNCELIVLSAGGHFIDRDGCTELHEVLRILEKMI